MAELNSGYTFDTLQEYPENRFALNAAKAIVRSPGKPYNPLYLYGKEGTGKTHLVQAMAHEYLKKGYKVIYATGEEFYSDMSIYDSLQIWVNKFTAWHEEANNKNAKYHETDVLILEDIECLPKGSMAIRQVCYCLGRDGNNKQLIITANKPVSKLKNLDEDDKMTASDFVEIVIKRHFPRQKKLKREVPGQQYFPGLFG